MNAYMKRPINTCKSVTLPVCMSVIYIVRNTCMLISGLYCAAYCTVVGYVCTHTCMHMQWNLANLDHPSNQDTSITSAILGASLS